MDTKRIIHKLKKAISSPNFALAQIVMREDVGRFISDISCLKLVYRLYMGRRLNWNNPQLFSEKLQRLKLINRSDLCTMLVDKYAVKKWIESNYDTKELKLIPTLGVWSKFDDIDFDSLPDEFVLKCTHDSGSVVICHDKGTFNLAFAKKKLTAALKRNYFWRGREYPYKNVPPRIMAEPLMHDKKNEDLPDYKFFCFDGEPKMLFYASERFNKEGHPPFFDYYDMDLNHLDLRSKGHQNNPSHLAPFPQFEVMKEICKKLSKGFPHIRLDFYIINDEVFFGEFTFHHDGGFVAFIPEEWDQILGEWIKL